MAAAGAADGDGETVLALLNVVRQQVLYHVGQLVHKYVGLLEFENIVTHIRVHPAVEFELLHIKGIGQEAHVEHEIRVQRHAVLEAEGHHVDHDRPVGRGVGKMRVQLVVELAEGQMRGIDNVVGYIPNGA